MLFFVFLSFVLKKSSQVKNHHYLLALLSCEANPDLLLVLMNQSLTCCIDSPDSAMSANFSCSVGYGASLWTTNHLLSTSLMPLGWLGRFLLPLPCS